MEEEGKKKVRTRDASRSVTRFRTEHRDAELTAIETWNERPPKKMRKKGCFERGATRESARSMGGRGRLERAEFSTHQPHELLEQGSKDPAISTPESEDRKGDTRSSREDDEKTESDLRNERETKSAREAVDVRLSFPSASLHSHSMLGRRRDPVSG